MIAELIVEIDADPDFEVMSKRAEVAIRAAKAGVPHVTEWGLKSRKALKNGTMQWVFIPLRGNLFAWLHDVQCDGIQPQGEPESGLQLLGFYGTPDWLPKHMLEVSYDDFLKWKAEKEEPKPMPESGPLPPGFYYIEPGPFCSYCLGFGRCPHCEGKD